jgi:hypothetical protein
LEEVENKSVQFWKRQTCKSNPISSNMNDDGFTDLIAPTHEMEASVRALKTKEYDLRPNRTIQSRIHLLVQEMRYLIHGTSLCMAVALLLLVGGAAVLVVQIGKKVVEGFELMFRER